MPDDQTLNSLLKSYGASGLAGAGGPINWGYWIANIVFGIIGWSVFAYGWKEKKVRPIAIGLVMMVYPYFITNTFWVFAVGIALTAALFLWRE